MPLMWFSLTARCSYPPATAWAALCSMWAAMRRRNSGANKNMRNELSTSVFFKGYVYGFDRDNLVCIDAATGEISWTGPRLGRGTLILVDGDLIALGDRGRLVLAEATHLAYQPLGEFVLASTERYWTAPAFSDRQIFVRNSLGGIVCLDLR